MDCASFELYAERRELLFYTVPDSCLIWTSSVHAHVGHAFNDALFAPWFSLATPDAMARTVDVGYFGADNDYGEMFYNFWLH